MKSLQNTITKLYKENLNEMAKWTRQRVDCDCKNLEEAKSLLQGGVELDTDWENTIWEAGFLSGILATKYATATWQKDLIKQLDFIRQGAECNYAREELSRLISSLQK